MALGVETSGALRLRYCASPELINPGAEMTIK